MQARVEYEPVVKRMPHYNICNNWLIVVIVHNILSLCYLKVHVHIAN